MATSVSRTKWNGKIGESDTHPSKSISENVFLTYDGKKNEDEIRAQPGPANLTKLWSGLTSESVSFENRLYFGDNLPILASLLSDPEVAGKVRLVYIDPPFSTGGVFQSRSMSDAYCDLLGGADFLEFLRQRVILLRELMAEDGSLYVHLDHNMAFHFKVILDEIFGKKNFRNWITRKKCHSKNFTRKSYGNVTDFILLYTKSNSYIWNRPYEQWTDQRATKEYEYIEDQTGRRFKKVPIHAPGVRRGETGKPWRGMLPPPGKHWQFLPSRLDEMDARGEIYWSGNGNPRRKVYLDESRGVPVNDLWLDFLDAHNQNIRITGYPTEKNPGLMERIILTSSNKDDLIMDCFSGSGTTLTTASMLKRRWIGIDNSLAAIGATFKRFTEGVRRMGDYVSQRSTVDAREAPTGNLDLFEFTNNDNQRSQVVGAGEASRQVVDFSFYTTDDWSSELEHVTSILKSISGTGQDRRF
jgi:adenine-specific DNA-methyltransferase